MYGTCANDLDMTSINRSLEEFLRPLAISSSVVHELSRELAETFRSLSAESLDQFLPTPISESILRPVAGRDHGRYVKFHPAIGGCAHPTLPLRDLG